MGAEIDESSMTTGAVGDNTGCVGRRAVEGAGQPAETMQCSASGAWCVGGLCGGRDGAGKLVISRIFPCSLVRCGTDCDISRIEVSSRTASKAV